MHKLRVLWHVILGRPLIYKCKFTGSQPTDSGYNVGHLLTIENPNTLITDCRFIGGGDSIKFGELSPYLQERGRKYGMEG